MPSNFKRLVRARMAETGESWQPAARWVRKQESDRLLMDFADEVVRASDVKHFFPPEDE